MEWFEQRFLPPHALRELADREEKLAKAALDDGDSAYAAVHKGKAAEYREEARKRELR
jgi:hypothetical protein